MNLQSLKNRGRTEINIAIVTIEEPFYIPKMINDLIYISPSYINYVCIILVPMRPKKVSERKFISNQIQVFGFSQFMKISSLYMIRKFLNVISYGQYSVIKVAKNN